MMCIGLNWLEMCCWETTRSLFLSHTPARFYLSVELGFIVCFLHFMHICHARHYSTPRNVHYRKREKRRRRREATDTSPDHLLTIKFCITNILSALLSIIS